MGEKIIDPELRKFFDSLKVKDAKPVTKPVETKEKTLYKDEPVKVPKKHDKLLEERRAEFQKYDNDKEHYKDVAFNQKTGGLKATHVNHKDHPNDDKKYFAEQLTGDDLEKEFQNVAFKRGHSVIYRAESKNKADLDMYLNGIKMDLISVTEDSPTFRNQLGRKNTQLTKYNVLYDEENESVCMYFHEPAYYSESKIREGIDMLKKYGTDVKIKRVWVLLNDGSDLFDVTI